jgi:superfamily II DNA or RNA helicase
VTVYNTKITPNIRRDNLLLYRKGLFDVLISCRALDEGTNVPETAVAIIASATASQRQRIQRLGRVLRPSKGKQEALVYTIYATDPEEERLRTEALRLGPIASVEWFKTGREARG